MVELVREKLPEIQALCREHGVRRLELFGSAARGEDFDANKSDVDLVVSFGTTDSLDDLFSLHETLKSLFGREVDLIERKAITNPVIKQAILDERVILYAA